MKPKNILLSVLLLCFGLGISRSSAAAAKPVMVYYMPWFAAKPYHSEWGWHWTMGHFNPDIIVASGERQIASWYYPLIGPYDSLDPAVLEYHVLLMKLAGIDGVIVDWYGSANCLDYGENNEATLKLFEFTRKAHLKFALCYEDQTIQHLIDTNYISAKDAIPQAQKEMLYLQDHFFPDGSYLRFENRPVLLNFGPQFFITNGDWENIFSALNPSNRPAFFTEDNRVAAGVGAFSWPPMWMSQAPGTGGILSDAALRTYLADFEQKAAGWPMFISSAFPRFHDIYQRAGVRNYLGYLGDRHSDTLRETLARAMTNSSTLVQVVTWNDFGEGSMVEPTEEYGYRDLGIIQDLRRQFLQPEFSLHTNDLALAMQFYDMRRNVPDKSGASRKLDEVFNDIITDKLEQARNELNSMKDK
ncbi:MAG TPA: glycoside hydrolase family 71/99-like protein [Verrucomicrobiae bacterium]|jgi:hypothetical protein|nr:glycoside hydrolase family 71/99-like protein [Verrucomicrobiae bacterium]